MTSHLCVSALFLYHASLYKDAYTIKLRRALRRRCAALPLAERTYLTSAATEEAYNFRFPAPEFCGLLLSVAGASLTKLSPDQCAAKARPETSSRAARYSASVETARAAAFTQGTSRT